MFRRAAAFVVGLLACSSFQLPSQAAQVIVFGDSWGSLGAAPFAKEMKKHNVTVSNVAVSGSTSSDWASQPNYLRDVVRKNPDAKYVWLTIGGNDAKNELPLGKTVDQVLKELTQRSKTFLDPLFKDNSKIRVIQFGYDIVTFSKGLLCPAFGALVFAHCHGNITCVNTDFVRLQYDYVEGLDKLYDRHDSVNLLGTLQQIAGIPDAEVGHPNLDYYTPDYLMLDNCIHPTSQGFSDVFAELWKLYFAPRFEADADVDANADVDVDSDETADDN